LSHTPPVEIQRVTDQVLNGERFLRDATGLVSRRFSDNVIDLVSHDAAQRSSEYLIPPLCTHRPQRRRQHLSEVGAIHTKEWEHASIRYRRIRQADLGVDRLFNRSGFCGVSTQPVKGDNDDPVKLLSGLS
jgi:hypothetical protein